MKESHDHDDDGDDDDDDDNDDDEIRYLPNFFNIPGGDRTVLQRFLMIMALMVALLL